MKKIFALAIVAAAAAPAFAQSSVTLYGRLNVSAESTKNLTTTDSDNMLRSNGSYLGFRGVEDLGGGLKAGFNLQHGVNVDEGSATGGNTFWNRESELYLQGNWGTVRLGAWTPETYLSTADYISMHNHDAGLSSDAFYVDSAYGTTNRVGYRTPKFGAFQAELDVAEGKMYAVSGTGSFGPVELGAGYSERDGTDKQASVRVNGNLGAFVVGGYYQHASFLGLGTRDSYRISAMYTMGNVELHGNVGFADEWSDVPDSDAKQYTLAVNYNLSKRTKVYGYYTAVDNSAFAYRGLGGQTFQSVAVGVRHNF